MGRKIGPKRSKTEQPEVATIRTEATPEQLTALDQAVDRVAARIREGWLRGEPFEGLKSGIAADPRDGVWMYKQEGGVKSICDLLPHGQHWKIVTYAVRLNQQDHPFRQFHTPLMRKLIESTVPGDPERSEDYEVSPKGVIGAMVRAHDAYPMESQRSETLTQQFEALLLLSEQRPQHLGGTALRSPDIA